jgi:enediyne biosynthesis protein E4
MWMPLLFSDALWQQGNGFVFQKVFPEPANSGEKESVGFTRMTPQQTGIQFINRLTPEQIVQNQNFMNGSGLAAGDFDGDGLCDLYFCSITGTNALYRNMGDWTFQDVTESSGLAMQGMHSTGAVFADINGDRLLDLLVSTLGYGVHRFLQDDQGQFQETSTAAGLVARTGSTSMALGDVDQDGDLDLYVANYGEIPIVHSGGSAKLKRINGQWVVTGPHAKRLRIVGTKLEEVGEPDRLYFNDGKGGFEAAGWDSDTFLDEDGKPFDEPWDFGLAVQMRDINHDGWVDIYVCNDFQTPDRIWINQGKGKFKALPQLAMRKQSYASMGVDFSDLDRDGWLDFLVVEMLAKDHAHQMTQVTGLRPEIPFPGRVDYRPETARNTLFKNRGDGTYAEIANYAGLSATDWSWQPVFLDVDLDGLEDLLVVNGMPFDIQDRDTLERIRAAGRQPVEEARANVLQYPERQTRNVAFRNQGALQFKDISTQWHFDHLGITHGIALADLDNDGDQDVITNNLNEPPYLLRNDTTSPRIAVRLQGQALNVQGIGASVALMTDGLPIQTQHMVSGGRYLSGDDPMRTFACGTGVEGATLRVIWPSGMVSTMKNLHANHIYLIKEREDQSLKPKSQLNADLPGLFEDVSSHLGHIHHEELFNDIARQALLPRLESQQGPGVAWMDLDADGFDELIIGSGRGGSVSVFRQDSKSEFAPVPSADFWIAPDDISGLCSWAWADGSRSLLIAVSHYESTVRKGSPLWQLTLTHDKRVSIEPVQSVLSTPSSPGPLAAADMDADGSLELFMGGRVIPGHFPRPADSKLFRQKGSILVEDSANKDLFRGIGMVQGAIWSDLNRDGYPELILSLDWGAIQIYKNSQGHLSRWDPEVHWPDQTERLPLSFFKGWWRGVASGDLNADGRLDLVIGNWGLNDQYTADLGHPVELYYDDFNGNGRTDLFETHFSASMNAQVPVRNFNELRQTIPQFQHFGSHQSFSKMKLIELLPHFSKQPESVAVTVLESMMLINHGHYFEARRLPFEAQWSPAFSVHIGDANADGHEDVFLSQNFFALPPGRARLDAGRGQWLKGDGTGNMQSMAGSETGVLVYGEQRGAALGDFDRDGRIDLAVSQNAAQTKLFHNQSKKFGLRIQLKGPLGNPNGYGAILQLETIKGMGPVREIHAGSGYGSNDGSIQVLGFNAEPKKLHVTWPGGKVTSHPVAPGTVEILIQSLHP